MRFETAFSIVILSSVIDTKVTATACLAAIPLLQAKAVGIITHN